MAESLSIPSSKVRSEVYSALFPQLEAILADETDFIANLANTAAVLKEAFGFLWVGFYRVLDSELVLGPFQGPLACTRISFDRGVCGQAYRLKQTVIVPDVDAFPGHIACSSLSRSEIVVPLFNQKNEVVAVLDIDSEELNDFSELDRVSLEKILSYFKDTL